MFLAIINDTYGEVKGELKRAKPSFQLGDFFMVGVNNVKAAAGVHDRQTCERCLTMLQNILVCLVAKSSNNIPHY